MAATPAVVMVGPALDSRGGIASVCAAYQRCGLMQRLGIVYIASFVSAGRLRKLQVATGALAQFLMMLLGRRVALLHVHMATGASAWRKSAFCVLARLFRVPYIVHLHSGKFPDYYEQRCGPLRRTLLRSLLQGSAWIFVLSSERLTWMAMQGFRTDRLSILPNMVDLPSDCAHDPQATTMLFLGRLEEAKGVSTLLDAFAALHRQRPDATLVLGGEGDRPRYEAQSQRLGISHAVSFLGWIDGPEKWAAMRGAGIFVLPSRYEGLPMGILEAMSLGIPCIATAVGGVPDIIQHGYNGLLVPDDHCEALARAMLEALDQPGLRSRLSAAARVTVEQRYSVVAVEAALRDTYLSLGWLPVEGGHEV